jgi:hypothetical protein
MVENSKPQSCIGIDGYVRSIDAENDLNSLLAGLFLQDTGGKVLDYLRSITMNAVVPHTEGAERLRHQEGMRDLFRIIQERINKGKEGKDVQDVGNQAVRTRGRRGRIRGSGTGSSVG